MYNTDKNILKIDNKEIIYSIIFSEKAKKIRLRIDARNGLRLVIPHYLPKQTGLKFLEQNLNWIKDSLRFLEPPKIQYLFLGNEIKIIHNKIHTQKNHSIVFLNNILTIESPHSSLETTEWLYEKWLKSQAKNFLIFRTYHLAKQHNFVINKVGVRETKTRFGSCSRTKNISLSSFLLRYTPDVIDYVIIHELCHTIEMNHSDKFWNLVKKISPNYIELKKNLKARN